MFELVNELFFLIPWLIFTKNNLLNITNYDYISAGETGFEFTL